MKREGEAPGDTGEVSLSSPIGAFILAGGESRRYGRDKATAPFRGRRMADWVADALREGVAEPVLVVARADACPGLEMPRILDQYPGLGPLAGIEAALRTVTTEWSLIVACDYPLISPALVRFLAQKTRQSCADAVVPVVGGRPHPLVAAYGLSCRLEALRRLQERQLKMIDFLSALRVDWLNESVWIEAGIDTRVFQNMNTPSALDLEVIRALESPGEPGAW